MTRPCGLGLLFLCALGLVGCGGSSAGVNLKPVQNTETPAKPNAPRDELTPDSPAKPGTAVNIAMQRKIVYNGTLTVEVSNFDTARKAMEDLLNQSGAYMAQTDISADAGRFRSGVFTIRVPADKFITLANALAELGNPIKNKIDSQDVTEEFIDTEARMKNLKAEEEVLNKLLKDMGGRLDDIFKIREHIRLNRGEIEKAEGRLQALSKITSVSTLTLTLRELSEYKAPTAPKPPEEPAFNIRAGSAWKGSLGGLISLLEAVGIMVIRITPWLPVLLVGYLAYRVTTRALLPKAVSK